ncbi:hypothetical protein EDB19DRAFT_331481 [Suillus lakei]|nr:hypothetical protein EDB19DRAFT_331481 [Suillus lakei]
MRQARIHCYSPLPVSLPNQILTSLPIQALQKATLVGEVLKASDIFQERFKILPQQPTTYKSFPIRSPRFTLFTDPYSILHVADLRAWVHSCVKVVYRVSSLAHSRRFFINQTAISLQWYYSWLRQGDDTTVTAHRRTQPHPAPAHVLGVQLWHLHWQLREIFGNILDTTSHWQLGVYFVSITSGSLPSLESGPRYPIEIVLK